jgi:hypothetical protein
MNNSVCEANGQPHNCPVCGKPDLPNTRVMCFSHWSRLSSMMQDRLRRTWKDGEGDGTEEHEAAMADCLRSLGVGGKGGACAK